MSYLVLARKYRPQTFSEVYAQEHITNILENTIKLNRIAHAYLFTGPRGVGKTSMARIFAKSLNCITNGTSIQPCNQCQNCNEITQGISADVIEIDGASNTGVEDIRDLQRELMYSTSNSLFKIYIIDEVHMLSKNAFNALLKTLEEPPENVIFIFATTEPHKVLATIISRCQRFDFKRIPIPAIVRRISTIAEVEELKIDENAKFLIAKKADGSMRDALSLLDQILAFGKAEITGNDIMEIFGIVDLDVYNNILKAVLDRDPATIVKTLHTILEKGNDIQEFINGLMDYIRNILLTKLNIDIPELSREIKVPVKELADNFTENELLYLISLLIKTKSDIKTSNNPILIAEMAFVKLSKLAVMTSMNRIKSIVSGKEQPVVIKRSTFKKPVNNGEESPLNKTQQVKKEIVEEVEKGKLHLKSLDLETAKKYQSEINEKIRKEKPFLYNYFKDCTIDSVENNFIHYIAAKPVFYKMLGDKKDMIQKLIAEFYGLQVRIDFTLKQKPKEDIIANPEIEDIERETPKLADFIKLTDSVIS
ncbi:DNA polymerase III subunit gamma/tau [Candidatus Cloacimonadota bacterium]